MTLFPACAGESTCSISGCKAHRAELDSASLKLSQQTKTVVMAVAGTSKGKRESRFQLAVRHASVQICSLGSHKERQNGLCGHRHHQP